MFIVLRGTTFIVPLLSLRRDSPPKSSPTFSVRPRSSVGRVTVDLIQRSWVRFPPRSKYFFLYHVSPGKGTQGTTRGKEKKAVVFIVLRGTTFIVPLLSLLRDSPPKSSPTFSVRPRSSVDRVTVDLIQRSWVRFPPRSKYFFFTTCGSLIPFTRANAQWVIHGFN